MKFLISLVTKASILLLVLIVGLLPLIIPLAYDQWLLRGRGAPPIQVGSPMFTFALLSFATIPLAILVDVILIIAWSIEGIVSLLKTKRKIVEDVRMSKKKLGHKKHQQG